MTEKENDKNHGRCPFCNSENLYYKDYDHVDYTTVIVTIKCEDCYKKWENIYKLKETKEND